MKDAFHGSAYPAHGLVTTSRGPTHTIIHPYRGSSRSSRRRGTARTAPVWIQRASAHCFDRLPRIVLEVDVAWAAIPCWSGQARRWAQSTVPTAYALRYDTHVRPAMPHNPVSLKSLVAVAEARASFADHRTGRNCRPTNARLAEITGLTVRTVQRASTALRLLGVATEVGGLGIKAGDGRRCGRCTTAGLDLCHPISKGLISLIKPPVNQFLLPRTGATAPVAAP